jgi:hypothetical protein
VGAVPAGCTKINRRACIPPPWAMVSFKERQQPRRGLDRGCLTLSTRRRGRGQYDWRLSAEDPEGDAMPTTMSRAEPEEFLAAVHVGVLSVGARAVSTPTRRPVNIAQSPSAPT